MTAVTLTVLLLAARWCAPAAAGECISAEEAQRAATTALSNPDLFDLDARGPMTWVKLIHLQDFEHYRFEKHLQKALVRKNFWLVYATRKWPPNGSVHFGGSSAIFCDCHTGVVLDVMHEK